MYINPQALLEAAGYPATTPHKVLPDGRIAWVHRLLFTHAILVSSPERIHQGYEDRWCYTEKIRAEVALEDWTDQPEPTGWIRNPNTGRRRPDGDVTKEYVNL